MKTTTGSGCRNKKRVEDISNESVISQAASGTAN